MPLAGESAKSRASAHYRWGARYLREYEPQRASAHFGRAEHYMTMFGTQPAYTWETKPAGICTHQMLSRHGRCVSVKRPTMYSLL
jgi:hypothetical protein